MIIRKAKLSDAQGIAKVHVDCWRTTYKNIIPNEFLDNLSYDQRKDLWIRNISNEQNYVFVAENDEGLIIGFADGGKRETNKVDHSGDLTSIYVLQESQGIGIGRQLVQQLFSKLDELGYKTIFVEVLEDNKSRFFYESLGAEWLRTEKIKIAGAELNLLVYEWKDIRSALLHR
ncbi:GNAT family N-acetyltransferase [Peribacillus acanthi]|uniref:GNAT family N-acetyltransferase n=1 Tax=Peribacillus acanthi TaxID=2171554 RepID=UPI000D3E7896|nr:GNAT family N-acetyltransferase [Peribacillus acanthi]